MLPVPLMECLICRGWYLAMVAPCIEVVVNREARQRFECDLGRLCCNAVSLRMAQQFASYNHRLLFRELSLMFLVHDGAPGISPVIGYDKASKIAHYAMDNDMTLKGAALKLGLVTEDEFDRVVDPSKMVKPYVAGNVGV